MRLVLMLACVSCVALAASPSAALKPFVTPPEDKVVGTSRAIAVVPSLEDAEVGPHGGRVWRFTHLERDAAFLKPHFADFNLLPGDRLIVRGASGRVVEELTGRGPRGAGSFWGLSVFGDTIELELHTRRAYHQVPFRIDEVIVGDAAMFEPLDLGASPESVCAPPDYEPAACYFGGPDLVKEANLRASVGVMSVDTNPVTQGTWCSGSTLSADGHVLTNQHCIESQGDCNSAEFVYRYWNTECGPSPIATDWVSVRCDQVLAQSPFISCDAGLGDLDFTLASVMSTAGVDEFGFVSVDSSPLASSEAIYIVQHPDGRPKEIAHGEGADVVVDGTVLRYYDTLDTEGGSSGSPIFRESDDLLVGLHHCGGCETPGVGNRGMLMSDIYPHIQGFLCTTEASAALSASIPEEVVGDGDALIEPGETWQVVLGVRNRSCSTDLEGVSATVTVGAGSTAVVLLDSAVVFGDVPAGELSQSLAPVQFEVTGGCGGAVELDIEDLVATNVGSLGDHEGVLQAAVGGVVWTTVSSTDFAAGIPATWSVVDGGTGSGPAATWTTANPGGRSLPLTPPFAIADSDELGSGQTMDEQLISPTVSLPGGVAQVEVAFAHHFRAYSGGTAEKADLDVRSSATGGAWVTKQRFEGADASGTVLVDVSAEALGQPDFQYRFHYWDATFEWWWAVDDVVLRTGVAECSVFEPLFMDGFESGDTVEWSVTVP